MTPIPVRFIEIGKICKPHGLKGDMKVYPSSPDLSLFREIPCAYLAGPEGTRREVVISRVQPLGKFALLHLEGVDTIEDAEALAGKGLELPEDAFPELPEGEYYQFQILGMDVHAEAGDWLGIVEEIIETGSNDVYEVKGRDGKTFLMPAIRQVIQKIDLDEKKIIIHVMEGLLDVH